MPRLYWLFVLSLFLTSPAWGSLRYQDFEPANGTQSAYGSPQGSPPEYGWGFNGAVVSLSDSGDPVHSGSCSWKVTIPAGKPVNAGSGIASQTQAYQINFVPQCHDRLSFWVWSDPAQVGDHTVMIKFFDQGLYKHQGFGVWTDGQARYREWTHLQILFSRLPADFNLSLVDKIEFFHYWDGTYFYDDIDVASALSPDKDRLCLKEHFIPDCSEIYEPCLSAMPADLNPIADILLLQQQRLSDTLDHD